MHKSVIFYSLLALVLFIFPSNAQVESPTIPYTTEFTLLAQGLTASFTAKPNSPTEIPVESWREWATVENYTFGKDRGSLPMIADLDALHPYFRNKIEQLISLCESKGITLAIVETYRTHAKQNEYKSMGRKYTRSGGGHSKHQYGLAIDVVPLVDSVAQWDDYKLWRKIGLMGEQLGLRWGGRWRNPYDPGHFEWTGGLSSYHLSSGLMPHVPRNYINPCLEEDLNSLNDAWQAWETEQAVITRKQVATTKMK